MPSTGASATLWACWPWVPEQQATQNLSENARPFEEWPPDGTVASRSLWCGRVTSPAASSRGAPPHLHQLAHQETREPCGGPATSGMREGPRSQAGRIRPGLCVGLRLHLNPMGTGSQLSLTAGRPQDLRGIPRTHPQHYPPGQDPLLRTPTLRWAFCGAAGWPALLRLESKLVRGGRRSLENTTGQRTAWEIQGSCRPRPTWPRGDRGGNLGRSTAWLQGLQVGALLLPAPCFLGWGWAVVAVAAGPLPGTGLCSTKQPWAPTLRLLCVGTGAGGPRSPAVKGH